MKQSDALADNDGMRGFVPRSVVPLLVVVTLAAAGAAAAAGYGLTAPKRYRATAQLLVSPVPATDTTFTGVDVLRDSGGKRTAAASAAAMLSSPEVADAVRSQLGLTRPPDSLLDAIRARVVDSSDIVAVRAQDTSATGAAQLANAFAATLVSQRTATFQSQLATAIGHDEQQLQALTPATRSAAVGVALQQRLTKLHGFEGQPDPTIRVSAQAAAPSAAFWPKLPRLIGYGAGAGLAAGILVALLIALGRGGGAGLGASYDPSVSERLVKRFEQRADARIDALLAEQERLSGREKGLTAREDELAAQERALAARAEALDAHGEALAEEASVAASVASEQSVAELERREEELQARVAAVARREQELARRAGAVAAQERAAAEREEANERRAVELEERAAGLAAPVEELASLPAVDAGEPASAPVARVEEPASAPAAAPLAAVPDLAPAGEVEAAEQPPSTVDGRWNLFALERLVEEHGVEFPERVVEWHSYLYFLREYAAPDGTVPAGFDWLIQDTFSDLVA